jgi:phosphoserine phosphatase
MSKIKFATAFLAATGACFFVVSASVSQTRTVTNKTAANLPIVVVAQTKCNVEAYRVGFAGETPVTTNVRAKPDKNAELLKSITVKDEIVFYISGSNDNGWFEISKIETAVTATDETLFDGRCWVHSSTLDLSVAGGDAKLYSAPQKNS